MISGKLNPFLFHAFACGLQSEPYNRFIRDTPSSLASVLSVAAAHGVSCSLWLIKDTQLGATSFLAVWGFGDNLLLSVSSCSWP